MTEPALKKSRALNRAWFQTCSKRAAQAQDDPVRAAQRTADQGQTEAHDDDADVLDAVVGQEALQVVLADGKGNPQDTRDHAQDQDRYSPTPPAGSEAGR